MKFELSTKPLADALNLGVISANISNYFQSSCLAQLTASKKELRINLQASSVCTELTLKGMGDEDGPVTVFVSCSALKSIVNTFEGSTTTIEYVDGGIQLTSGSSKCTLAQLVDSDAGELLRPEIPAEGLSPSKIDMAPWKFIKDYQMYAAALSFVHPVYQNVWLGESGDVIVGDFDKSMFTFSKKNTLGKTCLLTDTIVNLLISLPEGAEIAPKDKTYIVSVTTDGFEYTSEITPKYEDEEGVGSYNSDAIMSAVNKTNDNKFVIDVAPISKFLSQSEILATSSDNRVDLTLSGSQLTIKDENVDVKVGVTGECKDFTVPLNMSLFKPVVSHVDTEKITMCPILEEDVASGVIIWTDSITVVLGAMDVAA